MFRKELIYLLVMVTILTLAIQACRNDNAPMRLPQAIKAERLHEDLASVKHNNSTRLEKRVEDRELFVVVMTITNIEGSRIQQHLHKDPNWLDDYAECDFPDRNSILHLNRGDQVTVKGDLHEVFDKKWFLFESGAVKLRDCGLIE